MLRGGMRNKLWNIGALAGAFICSYTPVMAASDNSAETYAGDYAAGSLPTGTFLALEYLGYSHSGAFIDSSGRTLSPSSAKIYEEFTRFAYIGDLGGHPLVLDAEIPAATLTNVNIPGTNNQVAGGLSDPVVHFTYFFTADAVAQRWLGLTNFFYLPLGRPYDNQKAINVSTARQFTDVVQVGYTEGLAKLSPIANNLFLDVISNASFHTRGEHPISFVNPPAALVPGVLTYDTLSQRNSYDLKAFIRYAPPTPVFFFLAVGIEKSWGGEQLASNGRFAITGTPITVPQPDLSLSRDDFLRGHLQFQLPFAQDFALAGDIFRDFDRVGGFQQNIGIEFRLTKLFYPSQPSKSR
jgi:hypothetical protein